MNGRSLSGAMKRAIAWRRLRHDLGEIQKPPTPSNGSLLTMRLKVMLAAVIALGLIALADRGVLGEVIQILETIF